MKYKPEAAKYIRPLLLLIPALLISGCTALPDTEPFVNASLQLRSAFSAGGDAVEEELTNMEGGEKYADQFHKEWKERIAATDALVTYADSLKSIVDAGNQGKESAARMAGALQELAQAAGIVLPPVDAAASVLTEGAEFIYAQIALTKAASSLEESLQRAQPAVERIAEILELDLKATDDILAVATADIQSSLEIKYNVEMAARLKLLKEQKEIYKKIQQDEELLAGGEIMDGSGTVVVMNRYEQRLLELDKLLATTDRWYKPMRKQTEAAKKRGQSARQLIAATRYALDQWAISHQQLVLAVKERQPVSVDSLVDAAREIQRLVRKVREQ